MTTKRTAGVEQSPSQVPALPPPYPYHDCREGGTGPEAESEGPVCSVLPSQHPADVFGAHFFRCFFCRIGDNRIEDHFCETGRELIVAMLDELEGRP
jgi:hypothetical protein